MTYSDFLVSQALMTARGEKARMQRRSKRSSERRAVRAIGRQAKGDSGPRNAGFEA